MAAKLAGSVLLVALPLLAGCVGSLSEKTKSPFALKPDGLNALDTITEEDKEDAAWFRSFYGTNHCGVWEGKCAPDDKESGGSAGGFWGGGMGPSDSGSASHSDSGSSGTSDSGN